MSLTVSEEPAAGREDDPDHQREERRDREEDHPDEEGRPASRRDDAMAEEPDRDQRILGSELPDHEGDDQGAPEAEQAERPRVGPRPPAVRYLVEREHHRGHPPDQERGADEVELPDQLRTERPERRDDEREASEADGDVHVEHPAPGGVLHDGAADERSCDDRDAEDSREGADHPRAGLGREDDGHDGDPDREEAAAAEPLDRRGRRSAP